MAVGSCLPGGSAPPHALTAEWNGATWTVMATSPEKASFDGVSCASATRPS
jgi:hypothetical protein